MLASFQSAFAKDAVMVKPGQDGMRRARMWARHAYILVMPAELGGRTAAPHYIYLDYPGGFGQTD